MISDAGITIEAAKREFELVEGIHAIVLHAFAKYFKDYFDQFLLMQKENQMGSA